MRKIPECSNTGCASKLVTSNSARNFEQPALSIRRAINKGIICPGTKVLEIGAGNLRNMFFILQNVDSVHLHVRENDKTIQRFKERYLLFKRRGGRILDRVLKKRIYDVVLCTFVLETICPEAKRNFYLKLIKSSLKKSGILIASFRGQGGVVGNKYQLCPQKDGLISPLHTFIKPHSISSLKNFLNACGFKNIVMLQKYRVDSPKNIHFAAYPES